MAEKYLVVKLRGEGINQDLRLTQSTPSPIRIGTMQSATMRIEKKVEDSDCEFALYRTGSGWNISIGEGLTCVSVSTSLNNATRIPLQNGLELALMAARNGRAQQVVSVRAEIRFDMTATDFDRYIIVRDLGSVSIGGRAGCDIRVLTEAAASESVTLMKSSNGWVLRNENCAYTVYRNTTEVKNEDLPIKNGDFFNVGDTMFHLSDNSLFFSGELPVQTGLAVIDVGHKGKKMEYPRFLRSTRVQHQVEMDEIEILPPKAKQEKEEENMLLKLMPMVVMLVALVLLRGVMGSGNFIYVLYSVITMGVSGVVTILTSKERKKKEIEKERVRKERYYQYINTVIEDIKMRRQDELRILDRIYRSPEDNIAIVRNFDKGLFDRSYKDGDFLDIRLGSGRREATIKIKTSIPEYKQLDDDLQDRVEEIAQEYKYLDNAPIVARLGVSNSIGVVGSRRWLYEMLKVMTVDLMVRQYYKELRIYYVIDEQEQEQFSWVRWLKNCTNDSNTIRTILCDAESTKLHLEHIYKILSEREMNAQDQSVWRTHYVIFVYHIDTIRNHPISNFFEECGNYGFHFVFMDEQESHIPRGCSQMIQLDRMLSSGTLFYTQNGEKKFEFSYLQIAEDRIREMVRRLTPVYVMESNLEEQLTKSITFYEMLGIDRIEQIDLGDNWRRAQVEKTLAAPLGVKTKNAIVSLDLHDSSKAHGPHGLVAGTTGSGKSEILQSYILSMALHYHPYEVTFLLIDFKGGGMANQFKNLPHLVGSITDIDGREINRSLKAIRAEQERRKRYFAQAGSDINNIHKYMCKYKEDPSSVPAPLPHLIIIVDEFAELKSEQPEFMKELISTARVGRSLGIHLILATQKPSGVVDPQIWSNSKFKLCLKVQTKEDSREMLHTPLAAEIREPGRAYFQVGNNEIFELFQSAYSGGTIPNADAEAARSFKIYELNMWGKRTMVYEQKPADKAGKEESARVPTQLEAVVDYVQAYCERMSIKKLPNICMPPLPSVIPLTKLDGVKPDVAEGIRVAVALYDDPEMQYQGDYVLNLTTSNVFIVGSAQTGKTSLLQAIMCDAIQHYTPEEVNFYIIDAGKMTLQNFEKAKHVGGIANVQEEEKIKNLFKLLSQIIQKRIARFMEMNIGTYRAYIEAGMRDMPQIVLVIDNIAAFREYYEQFDGTLQMLAREGLGAGISIVATGTSAGNMNYRTMVNFGTKIALNCNDVGEYSSLFGARCFAPFNFPGRGLAMIENRVVEAQFALPIDMEEDTTEKARADVLCTLLEENAAKYARSHVPAIPMVPQVLELSYIQAEFPEEIAMPYHIVLGMDYSTVECVSINLVETGYLAVCGRPRFGKKNVARMILEQIQSNILQQRTDAYIFDDSKRGLYSVSSLNCVKDYTNVADHWFGVVNDIYDELQERQETLYATDDLAEREKLLKRWPMKLMIVNGSASIAAINSNRNVANQIYTMIARWSECKVFVLFCDYPNGKLGLNLTELQKHIQSTGNYLLLDTLSNMKAVEVPYTEPRKFTKPFVLGDAFLRIDETYQMIKTIKASV